MTNAAGSMPLLSTVIRPMAFFSSHSDEATLGQIMPIVRRHNVLDAKVVPRWLQLRNRWIILFRIGYAKNRTGALWWSASEAGGLGPSLPFIHRASLGRAV